MSIILILVSFFSLKASAEIESFSYVSGNTLESIIDGESIFHDKLFDKVEIVGLGESVHGSHGFHKSRSLLIKKLISEYGYRILAFESPWNSVEKVNEYVNECNVKSKEILRSLVFAAWHDVEVFNLLNWICDFNKKNSEDKVKIVGFDIQGAKRDKDILLNYSISEHVFIKNNIQKCIDRNISKKVSEKSISLCRNELEKIIRKENLPIKVLLSAQSLLHYQGMILFQSAGLSTPSNSSASRHSRDLGMYELVELHRKRLKGQKMILYAHNWHISKQSQFMRSSVGVNSLGENLNKKYKSKYLSIGFTGHQVLINHAIFPMMTFPNPPPVLDEKRYPNSFELMLFKEKNDFFFINLNISEEKNRYYLLQDEGEPRFKVPGAHYDAILYQRYSAPLKSVFKEL